MDIIIPNIKTHGLAQKYGHEEVHSKKFLQYYNKKYPELSPNKA
jgi:hypothetical protein